MYLFPFSVFTRLTIYIQDTKQKLLTLLQASKEDASKLEALREYVTQIRKGVDVSSFGPAAQAELRQLVQIQEEISMKIAQERVLKGLLVAFKEMHGRYESIDRASSKTLRWIFNDKDSTGGRSVHDPENVDESDEDKSEESEFQAERTQGEEVSRAEADEAKVRARRVLLHWLSVSEEEGILHISGKLGSGKSTLMKFLYEHPHTKTELLKWAGKCYTCWLDAGLIFIYRGKKSCIRKLLLLESRLIKAEFTFWLVPGSSPRCVEIIS
jgi:ATPase subunit of ABC transporter with duplicated ATPase domains